MSEEDDHENMVASLCSYANCDKTVAFEHLSKSDWNFGVVADRGHWETLDVLKDHYGGMNQKKLAGFMIQVLGKKQVGSDRDNQQMDAALQASSRDSPQSPPKNAVQV